MFTIAPSAVIGGVFKGPTLGPLGGGGEAWKLEITNARVLCNHGGGGAWHIHPIETKSWGAIAPSPPRLPRPCPAPPLISESITGAHVAALIIGSWGHAWLCPQLQGQTEVKLGKTGWDLDLDLSFNLLGLSLDYAYYYYY